MPNNRLKIDYLPLTSLRPWGANPKSHDLGAIHVSIDNFSFRDPVSINKNNSEIEEGHGRVQALLQRKADGQDPPNHVIAENGDWLVPVLQYDDDEQTQHRYSLAHNRTTELGGFDMPKLADTLQGIATVDGSLLEGTGYDTEDLNNLLVDGIDYEKEWRGMPEFEQEDKTSFQAIHIHFKDQGAVNIFAKLIHQKITSKTRSLWFPQAERIDMTPVYET